MLKMLPFRLAVFFLLSTALVGCNLPVVTPEPVIETPLVPSEIPSATVLPLQPSDIPTAEPAPLETAQPLEPTPTDIPPVVVPLTIAYIKNGDVWLWVEGGSPTQLTNSGQYVDVSLSDDGLVIAVLRRISEYEIELWSVNADGSNEHQLVSSAELSTEDPGVLAVVPYIFKFIPHTHTLAYNTRGVIDGPGLLTYNDLNLVNTDSGVKQVLLPPGEGGNFIYSPDGAQVALSSPDHIDIISADGSNRRRVLNFEVVNTASEYWYSPSPVWASDSSWLAVLIPPREAFAIPTLPSKIYSIQADGSSTTELGSIEALYFPGAEWISPNLQRVLFTAMVGVPEENIRQVRMANLDGSGQVVIQEGGKLLGQGWVDDSSFLYSVGGSGEMFIVQSGSGVPDSLGLGVMSFKPAGMGRIAYLKSEGENWILTLWQAGVATAIDTFAGTFPTLDVVYDIP